MMKQENRLKPFPDKLYFSRLQQQFQFVDTAQAGSQAEYETLARLQQDGVSTFSLACITASGNIQCSTVPRLWALTREELHLKIDEAEYGKKLDALFNSSIQALQGLVRRLQPKTAPPPPPPPPTSGKRSPGPNAC